MIDIWTPGLEAGNIGVTSFIVIALIFFSTKFKVLDKNGVIAAAALGLGVGALGHWTWLIILLSFLGSSHKATKWRFDEKTELGLSESEDGHRGWTNVVANGGLPGIVALLSYISGDHENGLWMFTAAVAVAAADTFASEIGCLDNRVRMITTMKPCKAGINGGFSPNGQIAAAIGAIWVAAMALIIEYNPMYAAAAAIIGWLGCQVDSLLGALLENRGYMTKDSVNFSAISFGIIAMWWYLGMPVL